MRRRLRLRGSPAPTPGPIPGVPLFDPGVFAGNPSLHQVELLGGGLGDSVASLVYSAYGMARSLLAPTVSAPSSAAGPTVSVDRLNPLVPITSGGRNVSLFTGQGAGSYGGGGTDWGQIVGGLGQGIIGIFQQKAVNKQLKRLNRLAMGPLGIGAGGATGGGPYLPASFAPSGVPAAAGAGGGLLGTLGVLGAGAGMLGLGPDLLPGGLEESGTGLFGPDLFAPTRAGSRQRMIDAVHPTTGERVYWRPVGRPILFTGDRNLLLRTRKTVRKMSSAAGCGVAGGRFRRRRR